MEEICKKYQESKVVSFSNYDLNTLVSISVSSKEDGTEERNYSINLGGGAGDLYISFPNEKELSDFQSLLNSLIEKIKSIKL